MERDRRMFFFTQKEKNPSKSGKRLLALRQNAVEMQFDFSWQGLPDFS
jgi:hypothetical protein